MSAAGDYFVTPHAIARHRERIAPHLTYEQALALIIRALQRPARVDRHEGYLQITTHPPDAFRALVTAPESLDLLPVVRTILAPDTRPPNAYATLAPSQIVEVAFTVEGTLPPDHAYPLYSALSVLLPGLHEWPWLAVSPFERGNLRFRLPRAEIGQVTGLAGETLDVHTEHWARTIRLTTARLDFLRHASTLRARCVTIKYRKGAREFALTREVALAGAIARLAEMGISGEVEIPGVPAPGYDPSRRILTIRGMRVAGYTMTVSGLSPGDSLLLQARGLGGRRHFGCAWFKGAG